MTAGGIVAWGWYASAVSALFALGAMAAAHVVHLVSRGTRWVWMTGIVASVVVPVAVLVQPAAATIGAARGPVVSHPIADRWFLLLWGVASLLLLVRLGRALRIATRRAQEWSPTTVDGVPVLLARDEGPAVAGVWRPVIVLPEWILGLPEPDRSLALLHETEHLRARDQWIMLVSALVQALVPWNLALWYQLVRLRRAIEVDCDARVLRRHPDVARYGRLLLECARHGRASAERGIAGAAGIGAVRLALHGHARALAGRLRAMTAPELAWPVIAGRAVAFGVSAAVAVGAVPHVRRPPPIAWVSDRLAAGGTVAPAVPELRDANDPVIAIDAAGAVEQVSGPPLSATDAAALRTVHGPAVVRFIADPDRPTQTVAVVTYGRG